MFALCLLNSLLIHVCQVPSDQTRFNHRSSSEPGFHKRGLLSYRGLNQAISHISWSKGLLS